MARASNLMVGTLTLALIAGSVGGWLGYQRYAGIKRQVPFRVVFDGPASGLRRGASVNFAGVRIGEVTSLKLDRHRVVAMMRIEASAPIRKNTQVGLDFRGLSGLAAISFTGGSDDAPPPPAGADGIPELTADPEGMMGVQEQLRVALRNVDRIIAENEAGLKDTLRNLETVSASLSGDAESVADFIDAAQSKIDSVDDGIGRTEAFLKSLGSAKYDGELVPTLVSFRKLIQSWDKKSDTFIADTRKVLGDVRDSANDMSRKFGDPRAGR